jgi:hypothetical protein
MKVSEFVELIQKQKLDPEADPELVFESLGGEQMSPVGTKISRPVINIPVPHTFTVEPTPSIMETLTITLGRE